MPADETSQLKISEVSESITRTLDHLELIVNAFHDSTRRVVMKVVANFFKPTVDLFELPARGRDDTRLKCCFGLG
jgi:hypothetical protein